MTVEQIIIDIVKSASISGAVVIFILFLWKGPFTAILKDFLRNRILKKEDIEVESNHYTEVSKELREIKFVLQDNFQDIKLELRSQSRSLTSMNTDIAIVKDRLDR